MKRARSHDANHNIRDYQYTGFGSVYFVDFILIDKFFGIDRLLSVEYSEKVRKRVVFNRPYDKVAIEFGDVGEVIPKLSRDLRHILWLDYDNHLTSDHISHIRSACAHLPVGSILIITVDVDSTERLPREWFDCYTEDADGHEMLTI